MNLIEPIIKAAANANARVDGDYEQDGILFCGKCNTSKQCLIKPFGGRETKVFCACKCALEAFETEQRERREKEKQMYIQQLRSNGLRDPDAKTMRFENDDGSGLKIARRYVEKWEKMRRENIGLLLWGNTGNGKTFSAGCIANYLLDNGTSVLMTSFPRILGALSAMWKEDRIAYLDEFSKYDLLILDDLGAERDSAYAMEQVYDVIDTRYKSKKPLIVTTNLSLGELKNPKDMTYQRTYDRILEMCMPVHVQGESRRKGKATEKMRTARGILLENGD